MSSAAPLPRSHFFPASAPAASEALRRRRWGRLKDCFSASVSVRAARRELKNAIVESAIAQAEDVQQIVLLDTPGLQRALLGELVHSPLDIAGAERDRWQALHRGIGTARRAVGVTTPFHVVEQSTDVAADEFGLQRPGGIAVTDYRGKVRHLAIEHALVAQFVCRVDGLTINDEFGTTEDLQIETGCGHHDVGCKLPAGA